MPHAPISRRSVIGVGSPLAALTVAALPTPTRPSLVGLLRPRCSTRPGPGAGLQGRVVGVVPGELLEHRDAAVGEFTSPRTWRIATGLRFGHAADPSAVATSTTTSVCRDEVAVVRRKDYDEKLAKIRVPKGAKLTPSKKVPGALSPLVHGKKGVNAQAVVIPVGSRERSRGFLGSLLGFLVKAVLALLALGVVFVLASAVLAAVLEGAAVGLETVTEAASSASAYLVVGAAGLALLALVMVVLRAGWFGARRRARKRASAEAAAVRHQATQAMPAPRFAPSTAPAYWYADPWDAAQFRYWDGATWTGHVRPRFAHPAPVAVPFAPQVTDIQATRVHDDRRITMSSAEWQNLMRAWLAAGAVEQALWQRLVHARISDADQVTLQAQSRMEQLTPELGAQKARLMLEANPHMRDDLPLLDFLASFLAAAGAARGEQARLEQVTERRTDGRGPWLL